jgi:hypothetical protein
MHARYLFSQRNQSLHNDLKYLHTIQLNTIVMYVYM